MGRTRQAVLAWRSRHRLPAPWRRWPRGLVTNVALVVAGGAGAVTGGWLMGRWWMGLVVVVLSAGVIYIGLNREDAQARPVRGTRTVEQVLDDELTVQRGADDRDTPY